MKAKIWNFRGWVKGTDPSELNGYYARLLNDSGFNIESAQEKHFQPYGYTALFLLSESHFAIHTFPEENKTYIELSSCVETPFGRFVQTHKKQREYSESE